MSDTLDRLRQANTDRQAEWPGSNTVDYLFRMVELSGECGELANAVKKYHRSKANILGNVVSDDEVIKNMIDEMGDVLICLDLLAMEIERAGVSVDLTQALTDKFNATSIKHNMQTRL
jgi:NTP pyrophosphatase (non-canonical NTP hydrolase)